METACLLGKSRSLKQKLGVQARPACKLGCWNPITPLLRVTAQDRDALRLSMTVPSYVSLLG